MVSLPLQRTGRTLRGFALAICLTLAACLALAGTATAETVGTTTFKIQPSVKKKLTGKGLRVGRSGSAKANGRNWTVDMARGELRPASGVAFAHHRAGSFVVKGKVKVKKKKNGKWRKRNRSLRFGNFVVFVNGNSSWVSARVAGTQMVVFRFRDVPDPPFNPISGDIILENLKLATTADFRRAFKQKFHRKLPKNFGRMSLDANLPPHSPDREEPPVVDRPDGTLDVVAAQADWRPRESWTCYLKTGSFATGNVIPLPANFSDLPYPPPASHSGCPGLTWNFTYRLPESMFVDGWHNPDTGETWVNFDDTGEVRFSKPEFNLDLRLTSGEIGLNGAGNSIVFATNGPDHRPDPWTGERAVYADMDPEALPEPVTETDPVTGDVTYTYSYIPLTMPRGLTAWDGSSFYPESLPENGRLTITFTVDYPAGG